MGGTRAGYIGANPEQEEADAILVDFAAEAKHGDPSSEAAQGLVLRWRDHLAKFHNGCDGETLRRLAGLYGADDRFAEHLDSFGDGTARFMGEAIEAYLEK